MRPRVIQKRFHLHLLWGPDDEKKAYDFDKIGWCVKSLGLKMPNGDGFISDPRPDVS